RHRRPQKRQEPQRTVVEFWDRFNSKHPGKAYTLLPDNFYATRAAGAHARRAILHGVNALASYEQAVEECCAKVTKIVEECRRINQKYRDPHFDIEADLKRMITDRQPPDSLMGLADTVLKLRPMSVKRVEDIFEDPRFFIEGATANDVRQGKEGDCWFMSALCTLSNKEALIPRVCVARNEQVGVYGFVFRRDGEWISEVIDDKLYLIKEDYDDSALERNNFLQLQNRATPDDEYKAVMQTGSRALYFAQCSDQNETWLPLLEKAYAKAHGDYAALESGFVGEGIEDLTGGVTTEVFSSDILDRDKFWGELMRVNEDFLFGCGQMGGIYGSRKGILEKHAYGIMEAREIEHEGKVHRLLKLRNPWGNTEWKGPWSDGSSEWTPFWMEKLKHKFGDDGVFWISYKDLLRHYQHFDRTRLFGRDWTVTQQWTSVQVPWSSNFLDTQFRITVEKNVPVVIVLSQLDDRYFRGLEGPYEFHLQFRLHRKGEEDYIVRSNGAYYMRRSVSVELTEPELEAGEYTVMLKVTAKRYSGEPPPEQVVQQVCHTRREKLLSVGLSYDLAHAKGQFRPLEKNRSHAEKRRRHEEQKKWIRKMFEKERSARKRAKWRAIRIEEKKSLKEEQRYAARLAELERIEEEREK
ncbi:cysteine proteinase, partial [Eremomyces bilateralis CBS 781.70]